MPTHSGDSPRRVARQTKIAERKAYAPQPRRRKYPVAGGLGGLRYAKTGGGGLTARSGTTLGSGTITFYARSGSTIALGTETATCYNVTTGAVAANATIVVGPDDGTPPGWVAIVEDC